MIYFFIILFLTSLFLGSFANNLVSRLGSNSKFDLLRSTCRCGKRKLDICEMIPVISWLRSGGKCENCNSRLPVRYPLVEFLSSVFAFFVYFIYDLTAEALVIYFAFYIMMIIAFTDLESWSIPDALPALLIALGIIRLIIISPDYSMTAVSMVVPTLLLIIKEFFLRVKKRDIIGYGDIKYLFALFLFFPFFTSLLSLWISALIAVITYYYLRFRDIKLFGEGLVPFGFFLSAGFILGGLAGDNLINIYKNMLF